MNPRQIIRFGPDHALHGTLHLPEAAPTKGLVICAPFGEEAKCAYRPLYEMADLAAAKGATALRFDYFGTGNSKGRFEDFAPSRARDDIRAAMAYARGQGLKKVGILGLGLGATLAFETAAESEVDFLVMWQPMVSGEEFYRLNIKRQLLRQMLTHGKAKGARSQGDIIDLDGYPLRKQTVEQLKALSLPGRAQANTPPTLIVQISFTSNMAADLRALADACRPKPDTECIVCEPFWKRIGFVDCSAVYDATSNWLDRQ